MVWISRALDQWGQNIRLDKGEFIDLGALSQDTGLNTLARTQGVGANPLLWQLPEA